MFLIFFFLLPSLALSRLCCLPWGGGQKERKRGTFSPPASSTYPSSPRGRKRKRKKPASHGIRTMRGENGGITRGKKEGASLLSQQSQRKGVPTSQSRREEGGEVKGKKEGRKEATELRATKTHLSVRLRLRLLPIQYTIFILRFNFAPLPFFLSPFLPFLFLFITLPFSFL